MLKCLTCPYKLGIIKCIKNPCIECRQSGQKTHPFGLWVNKVYKSHHSSQHKKTVKNNNTSNMLGGLMPACILNGR